MDTYVVSIFGILLLVISILSLDATRRLSSIQRSIEELREERRAFQEQTGAG